MQKIAINFLLDTAKEREIAQQTSQKFQFYTVGLVLIIQTQKNELVKQSIKRNKVHVDKI